MSRPPTADRLTDEVLVQRIAAGDRDAFAELYHRRRPDVFRFALHMTSEASLAEDVVQDVFMAVMDDAARFDPSRAVVVAWLCGIARNKLRQRLAGDRRLAPLAHDEDTLGWEAPGEPVLTGLLRQERIEAVRRAVLSLPLRYREAVVLCDLQELPYADAAAALDCAVGTVRSRLHRGRALLASKLQKASGSGLRPFDCAQRAPSKVEGQASGGVTASRATFEPRGVVS